MLFLRWLLIKFENMIDIESILLPCSRIKQSVSCSVGDQKYHGQQSLALVAQT